ncbi:hypothetical protein E8E13_000188 [Curvularia kusanoi]|uniref:Uncharacterized protein n=1 Tax=Curvularia kusanoi TaxID=90978 RepID=A0A9P4T534_CURKU|nr:hypothetical protein E8E13_000188 [Curvularia kusanoi]
MSDSTPTHTTRRLSRVASEDSVINKSIAVAEHSRSYQDTGVQTLPPANGDVYVQVYGCEPAAIDHFRMGIGAIGRFTEGAQSNLYEPVYGVAYPVPKKNEVECLDSGFQVSGCDATRLALTRAKARASMMANKYRKVAFEAGYEIWSEADDEMIVHSEQHPSTVRLDMQGNLLEGSTQGRYIPNIGGAARIDKSGRQREIAPAIREEASDLVQGDDPAGTSKGVEQLGLPQPALRYPETADAIVTEKIMSLAPSASAAASELTEITGDEYGSGDINDNVIVVCDATTLNDPSPPNKMTTPIFSPARQNCGGEWSNGEIAGKNKEPDVKSKRPIDLATSTSSSKKRRRDATRDSTKRVKVAEPTIVTEPKRPQSRNSVQRYAEPFDSRKALVRGESTQFSQRTTTRQEVLGDDSEVKYPPLILAPQIAVEQSADTQRAWNRIDTHRALAEEARSRNATLDEILNPAYVVALTSADLDDMLEIPQVMNDTVIEGQVAEGDGMDQTTLDHPESDSEGSSFCIGLLSPRSVGSTASLASEDSNFCFGLLSPLRPDQQDSPIANTADDRDISKTQDENGLGNAVQDTSEQAAVTEKLWHNRNERLSLAEAASRCLLEIPLAQTSEVPSKEHLAGVVYLNDDERIHLFNQFLEKNAERIAAFRARREKFEIDNPCTGKHQAIEIEYSSLWDHETELGLLTDAVLWLDALLSSFRTEIIEEDMAELKPRLEKLFTAIDQRMLPKLAGKGKQKVHPETEFRNDLYECMTEVSNSNSRRKQILKRTDIDVELFENLLLLAESVQHRTFSEDEFAGREALLKGLQRIYSTIFCTAPFARAEDNAQDQ